MFALLVGKAINNSDAIYFKIFDLPKSKAKKDFKVLLLRNKRILSILIYSRYFETRRKGVG
jgi:hypothetical protein